MNIQINKGTLEKTTKCNKDFSCLSGKMNELCKVELNVEDKIHFVNCVTTEPCNYKMPFGYSFVCQCPVRKELFNRYKI
ncbi:Uncharacterised protein [uncultured archaeon]|nr:Uncharacterised protein [uncultured archaeon]